MVDNQLSDDLHLLYKCFARREANLTCIVEEMNRYIKENGKAIITDEENVKDAIKFTQSLLDFKARMDRQIQFCFNSNIKFEKGRDLSFMEFMNQSQQPPYHMAAYLNNFLIKDCQGKTAQECDELLSSVIRLFCCLQERDTFVKNCEHYLHLRLLNKTMLNKETEEQLIKKIQQEVGFNSGAKMVSMFKDIDLSKDIVVEFNKTKESKQCEIELASVQVLSQGTWPIDMADALKLAYPLRLKKLHENFEDYYKRSKRNRTLHMLNQYGSCELKAGFNTKLIITTTVVQACILDCYNSSDNLTYGDLKKQLNIDEGILQGHLKPLVFGKGAIITK